MIPTLKIQMRYGDCDTICEINEKMPNVLGWLQEGKDGHS
jgi:hypothetical protein